jgi:hypothetical protein
MLVAYRPYKLTLTEVNVLSDFRNSPGLFVPFLYVQSRKSWQQLQEVNRFCGLFLPVRTVLRGECVDLRGMKKIY